MLDFNIPLAGMNRAESQLNQTAARLAGISGSPAGDTVDLSAEMISLIEARNNFAANTKAVQPEDEVTRSLLNVLG
jgi:flagellar hook protein FlgE